MITAQHNTHSLTQQLHHLTVILEQQQQIAQMCIENSKIYYQQISILLKQLSSINIVHKILKRSSLLKQNEIYEEQANILQKCEQMNNQILSEHICRQVISHFRSIEKLLKYCEGINIRTVGHGYVNNFIKQNVKIPDNSNCLRGSLQQLLDFVQDFHSEEVYRRMGEMCKVVEKDVRDYSLIIKNNNSSNHRTNLLQIQKKIMNNKINIKIVESEVYEYLLNLLGLNVNFQNIFTCTCSSEIIRCLSAIVVEELQRMPNWKKQRKGLIASLYAACQHYAQQFYANYCLEYEIADKKQNLILSQIMPIIFKCIGGTLSQHMTAIYNIQTTKQQITNLQQIIQQSCSNSPFNISFSHADKTEEYDDIRDSFRENIRQNRSSVVFKVLKTMHISSDNKIGVRDSKISKQDNPCENSRCCQSKDNKKMHEAWKERILKFGKKCLILRKDNPHFHQEIEVKRIVKISILSSTKVTVYFKKGHLLLEFIDKNTRSWVQYFKAIFVDYSGEIEFVRSHRGGKQNQVNNVSKSSRKLCSTTTQ